LRPPAPPAGFFVGFARDREGIAKSLGFPAIRAILGSGRDDNLLKNQGLFTKVAEFCGFSHVNELIYLLQIFFA
jgi:hypothetical protein